MLCWITNLGMGGSSGETVALYVYFDLNVVQSASFMVGIEDEKDISLEIEQNAYFRLET